MKIFLSYASGRRPLVEDVANSLRGRGFSVFLDKDDLPPAANYDKQIEQAVKQSDLMVFFIDPESVTKGRYTLTELKFARERWRSARGRVLPVLVAQTPLADVPSYLRTVQILTPEGNIAAEVASTVERMVPRAAPRAVLPVAIVGALLSSVLTSLATTKIMSSRATLDAPLSDALWFFPLLSFGVLIGFMFYWWNRRSLKDVFVIICSVVIAWVCAALLVQSVNLMFPMAQHDAALEFPYEQECSGEPAKAFEQLCEKLTPYVSEVENISMQLKGAGRLIAAVVGGFAGATIFAFGLALIATRMRRIESTALLSLLGLLSGIVTGSSQHLGLDSDHWLFATIVVWQVCIAAAIAWQLTKPMPLAAKI